MFLYNYGKVEKYKIAEAYIKLNLEFNTNNQDKLEFQLKNVIEKELLEFKYKEGISYLIVTKKGSLISKVVLYGTTIFNAICIYGEFRQGLNEVWTTSKNISEQIINTAIEDNNDINDETIIRTEKRTGLIGRLKRTTHRIETLQGDLPNLGNNQVQQELNKLKQDLSDMLEMLSIQERDTIIELLPNNIKNNLPNPNPSGVLKMYNRYALKPEDTGFEYE